MATAATATAAKGWAAATGLATAATATAAKGWAVAAGSAMVARVLRWRPRHWAQT